MSDKKLGILMGWIVRWEALQGSELKPLPDKKVFKSKNDLPILEDYQGAAPDLFRDVSPKNMVQPVPPIIDSERLQEQQGLNCCLPGSAS